MYFETSKKTECCGCSACAEACPEKCIGMTEDAEGFLYPAVDVIKCINCGICKRICPMDGAVIKWAKAKNTEACAGKDKDKDHVFESASGGAFSALAKWAICKGYTVFGVQYDINLHVEHAEAVTIEQCMPFRKSKYVQSNVKHSYSRIKELLVAGKKVLFSGTPCQNAALKSYLGQLGLNENLLLVEVICHGVSNSKLFDEELSCLAADNGEEVSSFEFKNKREFDGCVNARSCAITYHSGRQQVMSMNDNLYLRGYYNRLIYRPSCGVCPFAIPERCADITLGDAWGIEELYPDWDSQSGISLLLTHTQKGKDAVEALKGCMEWRTVSYAWAINANEQLRKPTDFNKNRTLFFRLLQKKGYKYAMQKCTKKSIHRIVVESIYGIIPKHMQKALKQIAKKIIQKS